MTASVKRVGTSGQISLGKEFAGRTVLIESTEPGVWLIKTARTIPDAELWLHQPEAANRLALQKNEAWVALKTLRLLQTMDWQQLVLSKGPRRELIQSRQSPQGQRLFSLRVSRSCRAVAWRDGDWLRLLSLHPDHDSA
jgi:hypothetical protein